MTAFETLNRPLSFPLPEIPLWGSFCAGRLGNLIYEWESLTREALGRAHRRSTGYRLARPRSATLSSGLKPKFGSSLSTVFASVLSHRCA